MSVLLIVVVGLAFLAAATASVILLRRWRAEQAEVRRVRRTFSRYVPPAIVQELLSRKDQSLFSGRQTTATILVCRIWNFAQFVETLTPEQTLQYLNEFYAIAGASVERHGGLLHSFLEDGVVAFFGVPVDDSQQEDHALRSAINITRLVALMQDKWASQARRPLRVGIGLNTGMVIAGDAGFANRREYSVVGPAVALAHRLQNATFDLNAYIVAARSTVDPVREEYNLIPVTGIPLRGVRALLDASIVRGLKRGDDVTMPRATAFAKTIIGANVDTLTPDELTLGMALDASPHISFGDGFDLSTDDTPIVNPQSVTYEALDEPPAPPPKASTPLKTRRRPAPPQFDQEVRGFEFPELRMPSLNPGDDEPIMPDPPPPRATYEDGKGQHPL